MDNQVRYRKGRTHARPASPTIESLTPSTDHYGRTTGERHHRHKGHGHHDEQLDPLHVDSPCSNLDMRSPVHSGAIQTNRDARNPQRIRWRHNDFPARRPSAVAGPPGNRPRSGTGDPPRRSRTELPESLAVRSLFTWTDAKSKLSINRHRSDRRLAPGRRRCVIASQ